MQVEKGEQQAVKGKPIANYVNEIFPSEDFDGKYRVRKIVGKGSYGYVAKAVRKSDDSYVAIKKITKLFQSLPETRRILRQIVLLKNCRHPNIVHMLQVRIPKSQTLENFDQIYLITEFCDSDLQKVFKSDNIFFELPDVRHILYQILCGLKYLHSANIVHRDLKPANVLINGQGLVVKICDFGLSRVIEELAPMDDEDNDSQPEEKPEEDPMGLKNNPNVTLMEEESAPEKKEEKEPPKKKRGLPGRQKTIAPGTRQKMEDQSTTMSIESKIKRRESLHNPVAKLTLRVTTRWYRAPEVILLEKGYSKPIDVWSAGCIFGELVKMQKSVCVSSLHRFPLFPGKYCFPVSPNTLNVIYKNGYPQGRNDQLAMILSTLGKPTQEDMSFLSDDNAKSYLKSIECRPKKGFQEMFPSLPVQLIEILNKTMTFDPRSRATVDQVLAHEFFNPIRRAEMEFTRLPLEMEFEINEENLTPQSLKHFFKKELAQYYPS